jgi:tetratricopeptide (TPR) repeat protein
MDEAKKCSEEIMAREPRSTLDAQVLATEFLSRNLKQKAFLALSSWLEGRPDDTSIFVRSMSLAKEIGDKASVERIMKKASAWLRVHAGDKAVRSSLLTLVRHSGTQDQVKEAIEQTFAWLEEHADDNHVRQAYLIVVRERGNSEQVKKAVDNTLSWLKEHPDDITIRSAFLPLVRDRGFLTIDDIRSALRDAEQWMKQHCPSPLFPQYLTLVRKVRKTEIDIQIGAELVKDLGYEFLNSCNWKDAAQAVDSFARWLSEEKFYAESESIYEKIPTDELPEAVKADVYFGYAMLFLAQAMNLELSPRDRMERLVKAEEKLRDALKAVKGHMARAYLAICLAEQRRPKEAAEEFNHVEWWARHTGMTPVTYTKYSPGKLFAEIAKFYLQFGRFEEAKYWYHRACDEEPKNFANWWGLGRATMGLGAILEERGRFEDAAKLYTDAISGLQKAQQFAPKPLQLPASRDIPQQIAECERRSRPP